MTYSYFILSAVSCVIFNEVISLILCNTFYMTHLQQKNAHSKYIYVCLNHFYKMRCKKASLHKKSSYTLVIHNSNENISTLVPKFEAHFTKKLYPM